MYVLAEVNFLKAVGMCVIVGFAVYGVVKAAQAVNEVINNSGHKQTS